VRLHPNAKTTPAARRLLIRRIREQSWTVPAAAEAAGISVRTAFEWLRGFEDEGERGLEVVN